MNKQEQLKHFEAIIAKMREVLISKGDDYANDDRLSNFKTVAQITGTTPARSCLNLIATKVARLGNLLNSKEPPRNESIRDSVLDLANYAILLDALLSENISNEEYIGEMRIGKPLNNKSIL